MAISLTHGQPDEALLGLLALNTPQGPDRVQVINPPPFPNDPTGGLGNLLSQMRAQPAVALTPSDPLAAMNPRIRSRRERLDKMADLEWQNIAKLFADPNANLTEDQKADILNQYQQQYAYRQMPNPIDVTAAKDESIPEVRLAKARETLRQSKAYTPEWDALVKINKDGEIDFRDLISWRELEKESGGAQTASNDKQLRKQAYDFELKQHALYKPQEPGDEATPQEIDQYKSEFNAWVAGQRRIWEQYYGDPSQYKTPMPPDVQQASAVEPAVRAQQVASTRGLPVVASYDQYVEQVAGNKLSEGDQFVDDVGGVWVIRNGRPQRAQ